MASERRILELEGKISVLEKELEDAVISIHDLKIENENLKKSSFHAFEYVNVNVLTVNMILDMYKKYATATDMFCDFIHNFYVNESYPNIMLKECRNGTYIYYDGKNFRKKIKKDTIINRIIKQFCMHVHRVLLQTSDNPTYVGVFTSESKLEVILNSLLEPLDDNKQGIRAFYDVFETEISNNHQLF